MLLISIPQPCRENWNEMSRCEQGAFCKACSEIVVDFTKLSDEEIKSYFLRHREQKTCGRVRPDQLIAAENVLPQLLASRISFWKKFLAIVFILFNGFLTGCLGPGPTMGKMIVKEPSKEIKGKNAGTVEKDTTISAPRNHE